MADKETDTIKYRRLRKVIFWLLFFLTAGGLYILFVIVTGLSLPCVFHEVFGVWCPGCGVSRMFLKIFKADFAGAYYENRFLFSTLPFLLAASAFRIYQYIEQKPFKKTVWFIVVMIVYAAAFLVYGVLRNFNAFSFLAPGSGV